MKDYDLLNGEVIPCMSYEEWRKRPKYHSPRLKESWKLTRDLREEVFNRDGHYCKICGEEHNLHIDHIIPLSKGGKTELSNLQVLCKKCNLQKYNKTMDEFILHLDSNGKNKNNKT